MIIKFLRERFFLNQVVEEWLGELAGGIKFLSDSTSMAMLLAVTIAMAQVNEITWHYGLYSLEKTQALVPG